MIIGRRAFLVSALAALGACGESKFRRYDGPEVTRIVIFKEKRVMYLLHGSKALRKYRIGLGGNPVGPKQFEGDMRTPEGVYFIDRRNPNSRYHLSLGISYPNARDIAFARAHGRNPGGDIFIHGEAGQKNGKAPDWTAGCIAVTDDEIEEIYAMVRLGTPVHIYP